MGSPQFGVSYPQEGSEYNSYVNTGTIAAKLQGQTARTAMQGANIAEYQATINFTTNVVLHETLGHLVTGNPGHTPGNEDLMSNGFYDTAAAFTTIGSLPEGYRNSGELIRKALKKAGYKCP